MKLARITPYALLMLCLVISACSSLPPRESLPTEQVNLSQLSHWQVRGKLSVQSPSERNSGYLNWKQQDQAYDLFISGPFGAHSSHLVGNDHQASLLLPGWEKPETAQSAEALMNKHLGWSFPMADLRYWVTGQPIPRYAAKAQYDEAGRLSSLQQQGWLVHYSRYHAQQGYQLPGLIKISGQDYRFVFAIQEWIIHD